MYKSRPLYYMQLQSGTQHCSGIFIFSINFIGYNIRGIVSIYFFSIWENCYVAATNACDLVDVKFYYFFISYFNSAIQCRAFVSGYLNKTPLLRGFHFHILYRWDSIAMILY
jgi:hypothetical protein